MKSKGDTADKKEKRLQALDKILQDYDREDHKGSPKEIIAKLAKKGFKISRTTLYDDYTDLGTSDPFVQDLANKSYSKLIHDCFDTIDFAERKAREILEKKWTRSKGVKKEVFIDGSKQTVLEKTITEEIAEPHLIAVREIRECAETKIKLLGGDIIKASAKRWSVQRSKDITKIAELQAELKELKIKSKA